VSRALLDRLGPVFRWSDARAIGANDPALAAWLRAGWIERLGHGLYRTTATEPDDLDLVIVAATVRRATICLTSALARHGLTDRIPDRIDVALPRGTRRPRITAPLRWHTFATDTFELDRAPIPLIDGLEIGLYGPRRSIVDAYRLRHLEGDEVAIEALRRWLEQPEALPSQLLATAAPFPHALRRLRDDLRVLG
jgi:hypothetical protein